MQALLSRYERELGWFDEASREFARRYPRIAGRLSTRGDLLEDPHVERLVQAFALLSARLHERLDDDFPLVTEALLGVLAPHWLQPFPSCSIARFVGDAGVAQLSGARTVPRGTLLHAGAVGGVACRFTSAYEVALAPLRIARAGPLPPGTAGPTLPPGALSWYAVEVELVSASASWATLGLPALRVFVDADAAQVAAWRDALLDHVAGVLLDDGRGCRAVDDARPREVGFADDERLVDGDERARPADALLREFFAFPAKFDFVDLPLPAALRDSPARRVRLLYALRSPARREARPWSALDAIGERQLLLGCTPVVNLFTQRAEPIRFSHEREAWPLVVDARRPAACEVHDVRRVRRLRQAQGDARAETVPPLYGLSHASADSRCWWTLRRDPSRAETAPGHEVELMLVDADLAPVANEVQTLVVDVRATNRDLPSQLSIGQPGGDLRCEEGTVAEEIRLMRRPTRSLRPRRGPGTLWQLVSRLALDRLSPAEGGLEALQETLRLHDLDDSPAGRQLRAGLLDLQQFAATAWLPGQPFPCLVRGTEVRLTVSDAAWVGSGIGLLGRILAACHAAAAPLNAFTRVRIVAETGGETLYDGGRRCGRGAAF